MFYYLNGTVAHIEPYLAVIDCGGVVMTPYWIRVFLLRSARMTPKPMVATPGSMPNTIMPSSLKFLRKRNQFIVSHFYWNGKPGLV